MKPALFLLHFSGGNSYSYNFLKPYLEDTFDFYALELPGRGRRLKEPYNRSLEEATEDLLRQVLQLKGHRPFVIYGHSLGASLGLLLTARLEAMDMPPIQLIVSGNSGPGPEADKRHKGFNQMTKTDFIEVLRIMGGLSDEILANQELMEFMLPILRADFWLNENKPRFKKVNTPIHALMGDQEELVEHIQNWKKFTSQDFKTTILPGHHFFIYEQVTPLAAQIKNALSLTELGG